MGRHHHHDLLRIFACMIVLFQLPLSRGWWVFSNDKTIHSSHESSTPVLVGAEFSINSLEDDEKAMNLVENARLQMRSSKSCWLAAYKNLFSGCSKVVADQELKDRLTWDLSDCFQKHSGRAAFPYCNPKYPTKNCLKKLDGDEHKVFLQYFLQIDSICHQLQIHAFKHETERLINDLKGSAEHAEDKLKKMEERGEILLENSKNIHSSLASIDLQTQQVAKTSRNIHDNVDVLKKFSEELYDQSKGIAATQTELNEGQQKMKETIEDGMKTIHESYDTLEASIANLKEETTEIEEEIGKVGDAMFSKMDSLQSKADDIENITGTSLDKQKELLNSQLVALDGLKILTTFQSQALEESRDTMQKLSELGKRQQEELLLRQQQLQQANDQLAENSLRMLAAQETFESKQARMLNALDRLFKLHNTLLMESQFIKVSIIYSLLIFVVYMFTSIKQTYSIRPRLYLGLCMSFLVEITIMRTKKSNLAYQTWMSMSARSLFVFLASTQLLYAFYTYRDYEVLNHQMLSTLIDKLNGIQKCKEVEWDTDMDDEVNWSSWVSEDLLDDVPTSEDPDYVSRDENIEVMKRYNFRNPRKYA